MSIKIKAATHAAQPQVKAFNERLMAAGAGWDFYESATPDWLAPTPGAKAWREHFLALDDKHGQVRGGYVLKQQAFWLGGNAALVANVQGPVSEGLISRRYAPLGALMMRDALARQPLQIAWGTSQKKVEVLAADGWGVHVFPLFLHVADFTAFFREARLLGDRSRLQSAARMLASFGLPQLALAGAQAALAARAPSLRAVAVTQEEGFGGWADEVWEAAKSAYGVIAERTAVALAQLMPMGEWPNATPLKVERAGVTLGWAAVRVRQSSVDPLFGNLKVGSLIDMLAVPGQEAVVAKAALAHLKHLGAEVIGASATHPDWIAALGRAGFLTIPDRRRFAASPELMAACGGLDKLARSLHLTLIDGDGPRVF